MTDLSTEIRFSRSMTDVLKCFYDISLIVGTHPFFTGYKREKKQKHKERAR